METREIYAKLQGDYEKMLRRLRREEMIRRFLAAFLEDEEFGKLEDAMNRHDDEAAFEAAHALKGVVTNMEFGFLAKSVIDLTESLRGGRKPEADDLFLQTKEDYHRTLDIIRKGL